MCGIVGFKGKNYNGIEVLIKGLESLEYRGYDSAGISYIKNGKINTIKEKGKLKQLKLKIDKKESTSLGIAHTRWATHGEANRTNAHPHTCENITLVHNGIIENYQSLKEDLVKKGYKFKSETDTEVIAVLLNDIYKKKKDMLVSIQELVDKLKGSYALAILVKGDDKLYAVRNKSPLILGIKDNNYFLASDIPAILAYTKDYCILEDKDIVIIDDNYQIINDKKKVQREVLTYQGSLEDVLKGGYAHYMLKEIHEQPTIIQNLLSLYLNEDKSNFSDKCPDLSKYKKIHIVGCGSAYHTGLVAKSLFEEYAHVETLVEVASEYRYKENFYDKNTLVIVISQSGETADTLASLEKAKNDHIDTLAIVNREDSSIARMADTTLYIQAGIEVAVATTKAYSAQVMLLAILALKYAYDHNRLSEKDLKNYLAPAKDMKKLIEKELKNTEKISFIRKVSKRKDIFFIGRKIDYALSMEGSLKLKEISYINAVSYQAGELKHGTISLIEKGTPVFAIITDDDIYDKTISNIKEVKARGAYVVCITNTKVGKDCYDEIIKVEKTNKFFQALISIIPLQVIAYETAKSLGCDIDKPRNLAKSVTVE